MAYNFQVKKPRRVIQLRGEKSAIVYEEVESVRRKKSTHEQFLSIIALGTELGFSLSVPISVGIVLGWWLDKKYATAPKMTLSLLFVGVLISALTLIKVVKKISKN